MEGDQHRSICECPATPPHAHVHTPLTVPRRQRRAMQRTGAVSRLVDPGLPQSPHQVLERAPSERHGLGLTERSCQRWQAEAAMAKDVSSGTLPVPPTELYPPPPHPPFIPNTSDPSQHKQVIQRDCAGHQLYQPSGSPPPPPSPKMPHQRWRALSKFSGLAMTECEACQPQQENGRRGGRMLQL